jgi:hypothetical protein
MRRLSKSKILSYRQCPKRLWFELHQPELRDDSSSQMAFSIGHLVGEIARMVYDPENRGTVIDIGELGHEEAMVRSVRLLSEGAGPIMEAGMMIQGALAYADVMLPDRSDGGLRWKMIEVKSSASVRSYHQDDIAIQAYIAEQSGVTLSSVSLAHIDTSFVYQGDGNYQGLLREVDFTEQVKTRFTDVSQWIAGAQEVAAMTEMPDVATGPQCGTPYACPFRHCCHVSSEAPDYPLGHLPHLHQKKRSQIESEQIIDVRDVPDHFLNALQRRVKQCSIENSAYFDAEGAAADLAAYSFPAYFLDFEAVQPPVPIWKHTRPYQPYPFQFSLHVMSEGGDLQHHSFLDLSGNDPRRGCAESLIQHCGTHGPIFAYNASYEAGTIRRLADRFSEHADALRGIVARFVDLMPIARARYYHPVQAGSWSLKSLLPAICPDLSYEQLDGVKNGNDAGSAFLEAVQAQTSPARKQEIHSHLYEYCKLDTLALVRIWQVFRGA